MLVDMLSPVPLYGTDAGAGPVPALRLPKVESGTGRRQQSETQLTLCFVALLSFILLLVYIVRLETARASLARALYDASILLCSTDLTLDQGHWASNPVASWSGKGGSRI